MFLRNSPFRRVLCATLLSLAFFAIPARAEADPDLPFTEPGVTYREFQKPYIPWLAGTLIIAACLLVAFKNPHRSHLD